MCSVLSLCQVSYDLGPYITRSGTNSGVLNARYTTVTLALYMNIDFQSIGTLYGFQLLRKEPYAVWDAVNVRTFIVKYHVPIILG
jgi:hypothetical protein